MRTALVTRTKTSLLVDTTDLDSCFLGGHMHLVLLRTCCSAQITFTISAENVLSVDATDLDSGRHYTWQTSGGALIANGVNAGMLRDGVLPYSTLTGTQVRWGLWDAWLPMRCFSASLLLAAEGCQAFTALVAAAGRSPLLQPASAAGLPRCCCLCLPNGRCCFCQTLALARASQLKAGPVRAARPHAGPCHPASLTCWQQAV